MGYCELGDLQTIIEKQKGKLFEESKVIKWMIQITMALMVMQMGI